MLPWSLVSCGSEREIRRHLEDYDDALAVEGAKCRAASNLPNEFMRSITWDQRPRLHSHLNFIATIGTLNFFGDPIRRCNEVQPKAPMGAAS